MIFPKIKRKDIIEVIHRLEPVLPRIMNKGTVPRIMNKGTVQRIMNKGTVQGIMNEKTVQMIMNEGIVQMIINKQIVQIIMVNTGKDQHLFVRTGTIINIRTTDEHRLVTDSLSRKLIISEMTDPCQAVGMCPNTGPDPIPEILDKLRIGRTGINIDPGEIDLIQGIIVDHPHLKVTDPPVLININGIRTTNLGKTVLTIMILPRTNIVQNVGTLLIMSFIVNIMNDTTLKCVQRVEMENISQMNVGTGKQEGMFR